MQRLSHPSRQATDRGSMDRYFFHIRRGHDLVRDPDGELRSGPEAARAEAIEAARDLVIDAMRTGRDIDDDRIEICDGSGAIVGIVRLVDVLPLRVRPGQGPVAAD